MFPSNWRKGINTIKRARKNIHHVIFKWLLSKGLTEFDSNQIIFELPIVFSIKTEYQNTFCSCFLITEKMRKYDQVLGISIVPDSNKIENNYDLFLLSTHSFSRTNFFILSENSALYHNSKIENNKFEDIIKFLITQVKNATKRSTTKYRFIEDWLGLI